MGGTGDTRRGLRVLVLSFLLTALLRLQAEAFYVQVDAHEEQCFFEQGFMGNNVTLRYQVMKGGFLDIDVEVKDPDDALLLRHVGQTTACFVFPVYLPGPYQVCFINRKSTLTPKEVMFTIDPGQAPAASTLEEDKLTNNLGEMVMELGVAIRAIKQEQQDMEVRQKTTRAINEYTNHILIVGALFDGIILFIITFGQIYYLKCFFQARRLRAQVNNTAA